MGCFSSDTKPKTSATYGFAKQEEIQEALNFALNKGEEEGLSMQLELHLACSKLKNMDTFSLTDSACVVLMKDKRFAYILHHIVRVYIRKWGRLTLSLTISTLYT